MHNDSQDMDSPEFNKIPSEETKRQTLEGKAIGAQAMEAQANGLQLIGSLALGALALGAIAIGALAIGKLAIGRLQIGRGHWKILNIEDLYIQRLHVGEVITGPRDQG
jgi:hypothetical protein